MNQRASQYSLLSHWWVSVSTCLPWAGNWDLFLLISSSDKFINIYMLCTFSSSYSLWWLYRQFESRREFESMTITKHKIIRRVSTVNEQDVPDEWFKLNFTQWMIKTLWLTVKIIKFYLLSTLVYTLISVHKTLYKTDTVLF